MKSPAARFGSRGAALILVALLLTLLCPLHSVSGEKNPSPCPNEEGSVVGTVDPDPPYRKVDYLFPVSSVRNPRLYVYKSRRRLLVLQDDTLIRDYPIGLGPSPVGDKQKRGDGRTPEGEFFVCVKNTRSKYHKSVGLSYPGKKHAAQALRVRPSPLRGLRDHSEGPGRKETASVDRPFSEETSVYTEEALMRIGPRGAWRSTTST